MPGAGQGPDLPAPSCRRLGTKHVNASGIMARPLSGRPRGVPGALGEAEPLERARCGLIRPRFVSPSAPRPPRGPRRRPSPGLPSPPHARQVFSLSKLKPAPLLVSEAAERFLCREGTIDILCHGAGSAKSVTRKIFKNTVFIHVFLEVWRSIVVALWIWGGGGWLSRVDGSVGRERVLLCSCGKTIPALEWKPRVLEMELDLQHCKTSVVLCLSGFPGCARWEWFVVWFFPGGI